MKTTFLTLACFTITLIGYSQSLVGQQDLVVPKGFALVPGGKLELADSSQITIHPFYISNEITNKEFREFYTHLKNTPNDSMHFINYAKSALQRTLVFEGKPHSEIFKEVIDESVWKTIPGKEDYFFNPKYDNYPVVGVTYAGAKYYCIWRTDQENQKNQSKLSDYRLPSEAEWEYASKSKEKPGKQNKELKPVMAGGKNELGIYNMSGNVAEWTNTQTEKDGKNYHIVMGGSWQKETGFASKEELESTRGYNYVGFRIVMGRITRY